MSSVATKCSVCSPLLATVLPRIVSSWAWLNEKLPEASTWASTLT